MAAWMDDSSFFEVDQDMKTLLCVTERMINGGGLTDKNWQLDKPVISIVIFFCRCVTAVVSTVFFYRLLRVKMSLS